MTNNDISKSATTKTTLGKRAAKKLWKLLTVHPQPQQQQQQSDGGSSGSDINTATPTQNAAASSKTCRDMTQPLADSFVNDKASTVSLSTKYSSTNSSSTLDSNSQKSLCTLNEAAKLFPRNMPSIRRSRRRLQQNGGTQSTREREASASGTTTTTTATTAIFNASHKSAFARVSQTHNVPKTMRAKHSSSSGSKKPKATCSKNQRSNNAPIAKTTATNSPKKCSKPSHKQSEKSPHKKSNTVAKLHHSAAPSYATTTQTTSQLSSIATTATTTTVPPSLQPKPPKQRPQPQFQRQETTTVVLHSQQSSLISYDMSCATSQQSIANDNVGHNKIGQNMSDDTFLSSGISCPSETHSEASATNSPTFHQTSVIRQTVAKAFQYSRRHNLVMDNADEEDELISLELAMITGCGGERGNALVSSQEITSQNKLATVPKSDPSLAVMGLQNLNKCRNRNAVWMHATVSDDQQLSDIEEQLHKIRSTRNGGNIGNTHGNGLKALK